MDLDAMVVSFIFAGAHLLSYAVAVGQAPVKALLGRHRQFDFGRVEPTAVLGCVVALQLLGDAPRLGRKRGYPCFLPGRRECLVERA